MSDTVLTPSHLVAEGLGWLLDFGLLASLEGQDELDFLAACRWAEYPAGHEIVTLGGKARGVDLVVEGQVSVFLPDDGATANVAIFRLGPGHLLGERSLFRGEPPSATVRAVTDVRSLHVSADAFRDLMERSPNLKAFVRGLVDIRERVDRLLELLLENPVLRALGRGDLMRFLQSGSLVHLEPGERLLSAGDDCGDVYVLVEGKLSVFAPHEANGPRELLARQGRGWFFGHAGLLLQSSRTADIEAHGTAEVLRVCERTFRKLIAGNLALQRRLLSELAVMDVRATAVAELARSHGRTIGVVGARVGYEADAVAYGLAAKIAASGRVVVLDAREGRRRGASQTLHGIPVDCTTHHERLRSVRPLARADRDAMLAAMLGELHADHTLIVVADPDGLAAESWHALQTLVVVREPGVELTSIPMRQGQRHLQVIRTHPKLQIPVPVQQGTMRLRVDPQATARFRESGDVGPLVAPGGSWERGMSRLLRLIERRSVGLALGGGGALGFAHIALIRALERENIPIDYVSGASFGSLVGGLYAAGGTPLLDVFVRRYRVMVAMAGISLFTLLPFATFVRHLTKGMHLGATEIPFLPVCLDITTGQEFAPVQGTVARGVRASSAMPGVFPSVRIHPRRLVDGGMINNVPASAVWKAGANFIVGSNVIPSVQNRRGGMGLPRPMSALYQRSVGRLDDLLHAVYMMMSRIGQDRATQADYVFNFYTEAQNINDFRKGLEILSAGQAQADGEIDRIVEAYRGGH